MTKRPIALAVGLLVSASLLGCSTTPTFPIKDRKTIFTYEPWRECDTLYGSFGKFLDAAGCYRALRQSQKWVCVKVVKVCPGNPGRQLRTENHEDRHCEEGDFHKGEVQDVVFETANC